MILEFMFSKSLIPLYYLHHMGNPENCTCLCNCKNHLEIDWSEFENMSVMTIEAELTDLSDEERKKLISNLTTCKQCQNGFHVTRYE
jgi:hypothetical protein